MAKKPEFELLSFKNDGALQNRSSSLTPQSLTSSLSSLCKVSEANEVGQIGKSSSNDNEGDSDSLNRNSDDLYTFNADNYLNSLEKRLEQNDFDPTLLNQNQIL